MSDMHSGAIDCYHTSYIARGRKEANLRKNYDFATDAYATTFVDIDVNCEACHGPGSTHVEWGERVGKEYEAAPDEDTGLGFQPRGNLLSDFRPTDSTTTG